MIPQALNIDDVQGDSVTPNSVIYLGVEAVSLIVS